MSDDFIPEGWLTLASAIEVVAARRFGHGLVSALTPDDHKKLEDWQECRKASRQVCFGHGYILMDDVGPEYPLEPPEVTATKRKEDDFKSQRMEAADWLRQKLYSGAIPSIILTDDGHHCAAPIHVWASENFESILLSGILKIGVSNAVSGRVLLSAAGLQAVLDGRPIPTRDATDRAETAEPAPEGPPRARGGRPAQYSWDDIWVEICRTMHNDGLPGTQAEMVRKIQDWCQTKFDKAPEDSTLKPKIRKLFAALREGGN